MARVIKQGYDVRRALLVLLQIEGPYHCPKCETDFEVDNEYDFEIETKSYESLTSPKFFTRIECPVCELNMQGPITTLDSIKELHHASSTNYGS